MNNDLNSALALFQSLYKTQKGDVYTIIERFILVGVKSKGLLSFTNEEIVALLAEAFNIDIPITIIRKCINSHQETFKYSQGKYVVLRPDDEEVDSIIQEMNRIEKYKVTIIDELVKFIEEDKRIAVSEDIKKQLGQSFFDFIVDREQVQENEYRLLITEFIILKEKDGDFQEFINSMKEGMIIYRGIRYSDSPNDNSWNFETDFFLDVEYLFSAFGLNGPFYEKSFMEFYDLVQEVNRASKMRGGRNRIRLYYFPGTKEDVDKYFNQAIRIRKLEERYTNPQAAMDKILSECGDEIKIGYYKAKFYQKLKELNIEEYKEEIDLIKNKNYLFESSEFDQAINEHFSEIQIDEVNDYIQIANYINILRQGKRSYPLEKCKFMFLSEGNLSNELSRFIRNYYIDSKPLVITRMSTFTELLWFKLKKGVINNGSRMTFSVVNKAKTIVSGLVHEHLKKQYDEVTNSNEDEETKKAYYADLRDKRYSPDDINSDTIADDIAFIDNKNYLEEYRRAQDFLKQQAAKSESLEKELAEEKEHKRQIIEKLESNVIETAELKTQLKREQDEKQEMNSRIIILEENIAKEKEQRKKSAIEQARKKMKYARFFYRFWWLWIIIIIVILFVVPPILWMKHEVATIYAVGGTLISLVAFIVAIKVKTKIRIFYIRKYRETLTFEMKK
jgi:hypothetical protein